MHQSSQEQKVKFNSVDLLLVSIFPVTGHCLLDTLTSIVYSALYILLSEKIIYMYSKQIFAIPISFGILSSPWIECLLET